jgi:hypothetical protein
LYGAGLLAVLSLIWSGYAITDLMHSGPFGLSVAIAGDIGWITVLWAEAKGVTIAGKAWAPIVAGWFIAVGVAVLLVFHGVDVGGQAQAIAGPFVVLVGKLVWTFALAAMRDPAAPTPEQQAELNAVMRDSAHEAGMLHARAQAQIARIRAEASVTLARDEADFEIGLERLDKRAELHRRTPLVLPPNTASALLPEPANTEFDEAAEQAITVIGEPEHDQPNTIASNPSTVREHVANKAVNRPNADREQERPDLQPSTPKAEPPTIADLVRAQIAITTDNAIAVRNILEFRPDANKGSVAAAVRRERRRSQMKDGYA